MQISLDTIKYKVFFKILDTGDFSFFSSNKKKQEKLKQVWGQLEEEFEILKKDKKKTKTIIINSRIESLYNKFRAINLCCEVLRFKYSEEAIEILKEHYFSIDKTHYAKELERIENESKSILIQIEKLKAQLPQETEVSDTKNTNLDDVILGYCSFVNIQIRPNEATVTEVLAIEKLFEAKLKELEKSKK
ncbi:hypothetical protein Danklef1_13 [Polaribacter phage Danklef_1]|uniref:Uncharacterized protein n=1 Tax=Polaribacter phage Danklef_1 TaxID=2745646 RepID=A0A8E5EBJ9_9CAUD|nr:hypothetical protein M1M23_gp13 [Polaribacter phage Danklef_1]QQV90492.1 hypothetical protein Danklef1_13 [Polaribacter phage Danklef_1]